ncbi:unnamed protein product [Penicillium glandicola]
MARLSNISVVVPLPSFDIDPLKTFDGDFFDRAVDSILSEEASIEESRDEMIDENIGVSSPFGYDGASDSSKPNLRRSRRTEAKSPHFSTSSTSSPTTSTAQKPKVRTSSRINKSVTLGDLSGHDEAASLKNTTRPRREEEVMQVQPHPIHEAGDHPSALHEITKSSEMPTGDNQMTAEDKIFVSVDPEKRMEVLKFVVTHGFMTEQVQHVRRSARREFTGQVREVAAEAGMNNSAIEALIDHVRKIYLEDREITAAEDAGSAFGDEVDSEEEIHTERSHRKRRKSSSDHTDEKENKKSKRRHSDKARRHSHDVLQHDTTNAIIGSPGTSSVIIDLTGSPPRDEFIDQEGAVTTQNETFHATEGFNKPHENHTEVITPQLSPDAPKDIVPESPLPERAVEGKPSKRREPSRTSNREKNRRKRERRKERKKHRMGFGGQKQPQGDSANGAENQVQGTAVDGPDQNQILPSIPRQPSFESSNGSRRSSSVTPSDEVQSKYFQGASNLKVGSKNRRETASWLYDLSMPHETRQLLKDLNLPPDFLSSDSSLSDAPSDFDSYLTDLDDPPSRIHMISLPKSPCPKPQSTGPSPETPTKRTSFIVPESIRTPQAKALKHSPYFPRVPVDAESCLPFPPIDASSFGLIQEQLAHDPFRLLIATIFLNRTRGGVALPVLFKVFERYPTIQAMAAADLPELVSMINCLGFQNQRARKCTTLAQTWLSEPPNKSKRYRKLHYPRKLDGRNVGREECIEEDDLRVAWEIAHLPGVGAYSLDSWRIFCRDELRGKASDWKGTDATGVGFVPEWKCVLPQDKELRAYLTWMWLKEGWVWDYNTGDLTLATDKMMRAAQSGGVAREEEGSWVLETSPVKAVNGLHESD